MTKDDMEAIWRSPHINQMNNLCRWNSYNNRVSAGRICNTVPGTPSPFYKTELKKCLGGHDFPPWPKAQPRDLEPSDEQKARYKANFPNNSKALIDAFGKTRTRYDTPLPGEFWYRDRCYISVTPFFSPDIDLGVKGLRRRSLSL